MKQKIITEVVKKECYTTATEVIVSTPSVMNLIY